MKNITTCVGTTWHKSLSRLPQQNTIIEGMGGKKETWGKNKMLQMNRICQVYCSILY